jgi:hypothetical protein
MTIKTRVGDLVNHQNDWKVYSYPPSAATLKNEGTSNQWLETSTAVINYESGRGKFNACKHAKLKQSCLNPIYYYGDTANYVLSEWVFIPNTLDQAWSNFGTSISSYVGYNSAEFAQRAIEVMTPSMESGFEVSNFLYEFKDVASLWTWWSKGKSFFRNLSQGSLNYSFGFLPFIGDVKRLYEGLSTFSERLNSLKTGAGKPQVRHYSEVASISDQESVTYINGGADRVTTCLTFPEGVNYTATMRYTYQFPDLDRLNSKLYGFLDSMGAQLDLYVLWNAIPFTFVVDWFFNVGDFLKQFRKKWIPVTLYIKEFGVSLKAYGQETCSVNRYYNRQFPSGEVDHWVRDYTYYHRKPLKVEDRLFNLSKTGSLTTRKFALGSLLLEQRVNRPVR